MDVDILKYATDDQMDMMLIMQMDKLPEFPDCDSFSASSEQELPTMEFSGGNAAIFTGNCDTPPEASPALLKLPPPISFPNHVQDRSCSPAARFSDAMAGKLRNPADGSCGTTALSKRSSMETMREMIFRIAAMQPIHIDPESVKPPKRRNVKISKDPQSVAARHRRERISERIRILQRLVPGGTKMDTASMLDEAVQYVKFLKTQVQSLERAATTRTTSTTSVAATAAGRSGFPAASHVNYAPFLKSYQSTQIFGPTQLLS